MKYFYLFVSAFDAAAAVTCFCRGETGWCAVFSICAVLMFASAIMREEKTDDEA